MKSKCSFILKATTALVLCLLLLFGTVATSLAAVVENADTGAEADVADEGADVDVAESGYTINGGKVYFDASGLTVNHLQIAIVGTDTNDWNRDCVHFEEMTLVSGTDNLYYKQVNGIGSKMNNPWGIIIFDANTVWGDYNDSTCNDLSGIKNNIDTNSNWNSSKNQYGTDLSSDNTYFITHSSNTDGFGLTVGTSVPSSLSYNQTAKVSIKAVGASSYTTKNSSNTSTGGTLKITGKVWSSKAVAASSTTASNYSASMDSAVKSSYAKLTTTTYSGYTFDGWYSTNTGTGTQYTTTTGYKVTGATTTYGRYSENANTVTFTKKLGSSAATSITTKSAGVTTKASYTAPDETGYTFTGWTITSGAANATNVTGTESASSTTVSLNATGSVTVQANYEQSGVPSLDSISDVSKTVNDTTFNVTASISDEDKKSGTLSATVSSDTTSVATVGSATVSGSTVTIPVTVKGPGTSEISVTLKDGTITRNTQTFDVSVATPTFSLTGKTIYANDKDVAACTVTDGGTTPTSIAWTTSNSSNVAVNASTGKLTAKKLNSNATIGASATYACGYTKEATGVTVNVANPTLTIQSSATSGKIGDTATASVKSATNPSLSSSTVGSYLWSTSDSTIIGISSATAASPTLTFKKNGTATIGLTVTYKNNGLTKSATAVSITVSAPTVTMSNSSQTVAIGNTYTRTATGSTFGSQASGVITYSSSNTSNATVNETTGEVTGVAVGTSTITATYTVTCGGQTTTKTAQYTVSIEAPSLDVKDGTTSVKNGTVYTTKGTNKILTVAPNFTDDLTVKSSNTNIATVAITGTGTSRTLTITPKAKGTCKVSVSTDSGYAPSAAIFPGASVFADKFDLAGVGAVATQTATFTVNVAESDTYHYVYFSNGGNWSSPVIHAWGTNGTPANRAVMTKIGVNNLGQDVYAYRFSATDWAKVQKIHFLSSASATWSDSSNSDNTHIFTGAELSHNGFYNDGTYDLELIKPQIQADNVTIDMGSTKTMTATVLTSGTPSTYNWSSGTTSVATTANTHTASNVITGVAPGTSTITIKAYAEKPTGWTSIVTNGTADDFVAGTTTATATVVAENKTITYRSKYSDNGTTWNNATNAQGTFTVKNGSTNVNSGASLPYNTTLTLTATPANGYAVEGVYWSIDNGSTWTKVDCTVSGGVYTNNAFKLNNNYLLEARFIKVYKLSAFDSYEMKNNQVTFVTAPPKSITIKHTDAHGTATTYTYSYDGTKAAGNPDSPDGTKPAALPIASDKYGQGNYIQYYAGDEITMTYSAMASSELLKGVFYNNDTEYYINKPTTTQYKPHDYTAAHTLYMNSSYYDSVPGSFDGVTVDQDSHSIKFTGTQDYKNIDVEIGTKRKVYFSDYTNTVITSKNVDDYYYDNEPLSVTGDQLKVAAAKSDTQTNTIDATKIKFYKANSDGTKGVEVDKTTLGITITGSTSSSTQETPSALVFNGNMPAYDLYIDLNMENSYTIKLGSIIVSDIMASKTILGEVADITIKDGSTTLLTSPSDSKVTSTSANVQTGKTIAFNSSWKTGWDPYYMFVGWYWGDETAPDYDKGFISDKVSLSYVPKKGGVIWAVGTRDLFINGTSYITGKNTNWNMVNNVQTNLPMKFDATYKSGNTVGRYYWEITDTMFAAAGNKFTANVNNSNGYWINNGSSGAAKTNWTAEGNSWFRIYDTETNDTNMNYWKDADGSQTTANGVTYGKAKDGDQSDDAGKKKNGLGYIKFTPANGYNSPIRIYAYPDKHIEVVATQTYSNLYVSNGYDVGNTKKTQAVTVEPVVNGNVVASGATGYFSVGKGTKYSPDVEGEVYKYTPAKKSATVRITKPSTATENVVAFFIYDIDNKTVRAEKNITKSDNNYYMDLTLAASQQNLYIVPIIEENAANVTVTFDATQLNRKQWGDIVTAYAWYQNNGGSALGGYPGQPMIPSDDMSTWTTKFVGTKGSNELEGITFSNYIDGIHSWLGCEGVMGTVTYSDTSVYGGLGDYTAITGGIINTYNAIKSGNSNEYSRANFKAQTYDYREPIALYERFKDTDDVTISFAMKDGNTSLLSWRHTELLYEGSGAYLASSTSKTPRNILNLPSGWGSLRWEYLTNAKGDKYIDMNGANIATKPTASFYVAAKGATIYTNSEMKTIFSGGKNYQQKGVDSATTKDLRWTDTVTYGGATGVSMNYAVEWYVYDAQGNYITTVLSAGIADLASDNSGDSYIGKILEDMGYAVDGKSVAICYDKPRYMYWDDPKNDGPVGNGTDATTGTAKHINTGDGFDVYRFTGQWNAAAHTDTVKVNVGVGMMTDSGEVLASSNTAPYGNATASYDTTKGDTSKYGSMVDDDGNLVTQTASDGSYVQTAVGDAVNNPVKLNATSTNFIGWYYYDANTGEFTKATYTSSENFYPNYTNKDVTYYAIYRAAAVYNYIYQGREGERIYSAAGEDLKDAEMVDNKVIYANHSEDILAKLPVGIGIFKKNIDFSAANADSWSKNNDTQYILKMSGFRVTSPEYTLTAHYKDASGDLVTITDSAVYNGKAINLTTGLYHDSKNNLKPGGTAVTSYYPGFIGWYEYDASNGKVGELLSTQANYGMRLTKNQHIIAQYKDDGKTLPSDNWRAFIDENEVNKELTTKDSGVFYNDTIVRVRNGSDVKAELPTGAKIGVIVVCNNKTTETINGYTEAQLTTLATSVAPGKTMGTKKGLSITNMQATGQTSFNRTDIAVRADYAKNLGANYCVYAYIFDGSNYHFSAPSEVKTYE